MDPYQPPSQIETPEPVPRGRLWMLLLTPLGLVLLINLVIGLSDLKGGYGEGFLIVPVIGLFVLIVCAVNFSRFMRHRYRGTSLVLVSLGYFMGEAVIGLAVWFGSCLLFVN
jgi:hypothetical protein